MYIPARRSVAGLGILLAALVVTPATPVAPAAPASAVPAASVASTVAAASTVVGAPERAAAPVRAAAPGDGGGGFGAVVGVRTGRVAFRPVLTADGIGPYRIGVSTRTGLLAQGLVTNVEEEQTCTGFYSGQATGRYAGILLLRFQGNRLVLLSSTDPTIRTRAGGRVGMTLDELEQQYGPQGAIEYGKWTLRAYVVPSGGRIIAFFEDPYTPYVYRIASGERDRVLASFVGGDDQC
ncbi:hypothetical protein [Plantactinospora endophytica]|uniref:Uncharacterized protein n=1 Tax=Plantactinospora endophytica TaxID=673535 RepID=A0ABQ4E9S2_9ACTN|nr:hypothetical protein [Plantactinospora endophytica]GIG91485.1 hypothetical protein Pen02_64210 [Plantactinospora endophytica]